MSEISDLRFAESEASRDLLIRHLIESDASFHPPLSSYSDIETYAAKLFERSLRIEAYVTGTLAGLVCYYISMDCAAYVSNFSVLPRFQGSGLAIKLFSHFKNSAASRFCNSIELEVYRQNQRAIRFYQSQGLSEIGGTSEKAIFGGPILKVLPR